MKTILITGSNGLLGQKLVCALYRDHGYRVIATSFSPNRMDDEGYEFELMDVTNKIEVDYMFDKYHPDVAIHTAAMTQVDTCEKKRTECWQTNVESVKILLENARKHNTHLIHLSSDFVFDGTNGPYSEEDTLNPLNYYGLSKQESEKLVMKYTGPWSIIRTSLVYGVNPSLARPNIVLWLRYALEEKQKIRINFDQYRTPTLVEDLVSGCMSVMEGERKGIYHIAGPEFLSVLDIAERVAAFYEYDQKLITPVSTAELRETGRRPLKAGLKIQKASVELGYTPHTFSEGLKVVSEQLNA